MSSKSILKYAALAAVFALMAAPAQAHILPGDPENFHAGFMHPISGLDHVLAMTAVGLLAAVMGGSALWKLPAAFIGMMVAGFAAGIGGVYLPFVEIGITASVIVIGLAVALGRNWSTAGAMTLVGLFAIFHGHAHGTEMAATSNALLYGAGFALATALLHGVGIALGRAAMGRHALVRGAGAAVALAGVALALA